MQKTYQPQEIEQKRYQLWEEGNYFSANAEDDKKQDSWSLMIPPPNVTGSLHMGHAFQDTIMDCLTRYNRMKGKNTLWQSGTDHAGIATQMVVERQLAAQSITKEELGRDAFIERIWQWKAQSGGTISKQLKRMGASVDWERECFTMDEKLSKSVRKVFVDLFNQGLIYRGKRLVNWDPKILSAISDLEVINKDEKGFLYYVRYPFVDGEVAGRKFLNIATTRPETILADGALAVSPDDERFKPFIGKKVWVPLTDRQIPVIADEYVDPEFGTGCVKITPAHDFNDYEVGQRHSMEIINLLTPDAHLNENTPKKYQGLDRFEAREVIIKDLEQEGLLEKTEEHQYKRPYGDRSGSVIEPFLTDQWYVKASSMAEKAIEVVKDNQIEFVPKSWENTYFQWLENIQDWCISRQLWWGHRIPVWYDDQGKVFVAENEEQAYQQAKESGYQGELRQDEDVLDTWFSSALWPFSTLGWPEQTKDLETFYPTSVLVTGFDIIFFWVARMIMFGTHFTGKVPFKQVYVHGLVRDSKGDKMSKSKGNVLDPIDIIDGIDLDTLLTKRTTGLMQNHLLSKIKKDTVEEFPDGIPAYGCDALRFTFTAMCSTGRDIRFNLSRCEGYRNFCNKLWNAARFSLMQLDKKIPANSSLSDKDTVVINLANQWIESRLHQTIKTFEEQLSQYRFDNIATTIYEFVWHDFCDWYIEMIKPILYKNPQQSIIDKLLHILDNVCRLSHPVIPYITEEIWLQIPTQNREVHQGKTIMLQPYPQFDNTKIQTDADQQMAWLQQLISSIRSLRSQANIKPCQKTNLYLEKIEVVEQKALEQYMPLVLSLGKVEDCQVNQQAPAGITTALGKVQITIPFDGQIDIEQEKQRIEKQIKKIEQQLEPLKAKLANKQYTEKAPESVINKTRDQYQQLQQNSEDLQQKLGEINASNTK